MNRMRMTAIAIGLAAFVAATGSGTAKDKSLYERLGGYDAIAAVTDSFLGKLVADKDFHVFFVGMSDDTKHRVRQHIVEFFCHATGGPCDYVGRDMKTAHAGLGITEAEWQQSLDYFAQTMNELKVPAQEQQDLAVALAPLEKDIVEKK